ncbi:MAG: cytochrome c oxidase assembly factor Coa1 family protein [Flavobacteriaceae bacterium]
MDDINRKKAWYQRTRSWLLIITTLFVLLFIWVLPSELPRNIAYLGKAYSEPEICNNALEIAKKNKRTKEVLGQLDPMGALALLEGAVHYSKDGNKVAITIKVAGSKTKNKIKSNIDIVAQKKAGEWEYQKIQIRIKGPVEMKETIPILLK